MSDTLADEVKALVRASGLEIVPWQEVLITTLCGRIAALELDVDALDTVVHRANPPGEPAPVVRNATFESAVDLMLDASSWVSDEHTPYVTAMYKLAKLLDSQQKPSAAALMEFRQNVNDLRKCAPESVEGEEKDAIDRAIEKFYESRS